MGTIVYMTNIAKLKAQLAQESGLGGTWGVNDARCVLRVTPYGGLPSRAARCSWVAVNDEPSWLHPGGASR